ncbi:MAG: hypothetical protein NZ750_08220 [Anaerolineae bacterium]|nr:hypothetical protein [Anaerolineae bacterium]MDW8172335.1 hypothetical protein [Anaerolineae bacterium]
MNHRPLLGAVLALLISSGVLSAQQATATPTGPVSTVNWLFTACADKAVIDLNGTMQRGFGLYIQVFRETQARGTPLTENIFINVAGEYRVSRELFYPTGQVLATGQFASMRLSIAPNGNPSRPVYTTIVDEVFDVCATPANPSTPVGGTTTVSPGGTTGSQPAPGTIISSSGVLKPDGGVLNPVFATAPESAVQIGARASKDERERGRVTDVGLIFAECNQVAGAAPGRLFDTDNLTIFWSWFARTPQQVQDHQAKAIYEVIFYAPGAPPQPLPVNPRPIVRRGNRHWAFYVVELGGSWAPGSYSVSYRVTWTEPTFDGFENFGPGTENPELRGDCSWEIEPNPYGVQVNHRWPILSP